ncbi:Hypothetical predicted protein [Paramuricea clavata]|uniref:Uncharacterized protein n=1 Tax=Paramuricea clavata TaxID=317549 RepID=A0A6S7I1H9_PARCT|nr:Hypothetical predicted protein [Paramuricea clavata]
MGTLLLTIVYLLECLENDKENLQRNGKQYVVPLVDDLCTGICKRFGEVMDDEQVIASSILISKFKANWTDDELQLQKEGQVGGGVALFAVDSLVVKRRHNLEIVGLEFLWVEFSASGSNFLCGVCYRPPDDNIISCSHFFDSFQKMLDIISLSPNKYKIVILGDFNAHYNKQIPSDSTEIGKQLTS